MSLLDYVSFEAGHCIEAIGPNQNHINFFIWGKLFPNPVLGLSNYTLLLVWVFTGDWY
jgi:hypothetical protein